MSKHRQDFVENLQRNSMKDHIEFVEKVIREKDKDYEKFKKIEKYLASLQAYQEWLEKNKK